MLQASRDVGRGADRLVARRFGGVAGVSRRRSLRRGLRRETRLAARKTPLSRASVTSPFRSTIEIVETVGIGRATPGSFHHTRVTSGISE